MNYWLHRISHCADASYPLLERGILSIGWSLFSSNSFIEENANDWDNFDKAFVDRGLGSKRSRYSLWRFITQMRKGDYVLVPQWKSFSIYKITSERAVSVEKLKINELTDSNGQSIIKGNNGFLYRSDDSDDANFIDLGFFHEVEPVVVNVSRSKFADKKLTSRLKIRIVNSNINNIKDSVDYAIENYKLDKPINLHSLIIEHTKNEVLSLIRRKLNPEKFEKLIKWYLKKAGASNVEIPSSNIRDKEGDADIIATFEQIKTIIYVQAKYHDGETSKWALEQINEYKSAKEDTDDDYTKIAWVVSSADTYSEECQTSAKETGVVLIDGPTLATMLIGIGISSLDNAF